MEHGQLRDSAGWQRVSLADGMALRLPPRQSGGFTLIEALMVVVIIALLTAVGVPTFKDLAISRGLRAQIDDIAATVRLARSEALKRSMPVTICQSNAPEAAVPVCNNANNWMTGWVTFVDRGVRGTFDGSDLVIRVQQSYPNSGGIVRSGSASITFLSAGIAPGIDGSFLLRPKLNTFDPKYPTYSRRVCINNSGATRLIQGEGGC